MLLSRAVADVRLLSQSQCSFQRVSVATECFPCGLEMDKSQSTANYSDTACNNRVFGFPFKRGSLRDLSLNGLDLSTCSPVKAAAAIAAATAHLLPHACVATHSCTHACAATLLYAVVTVTSCWPTSSFRPCSCQQPMPSTFLKHGFMCMPNMRTATLADGLGQLTRGVCVVCSVLVLRSCEGYVPGVHHMWCCTARHCNILYTQQALEDLGYTALEDLAYFECVAKEEGGGSAGSSDAGAGPVVSPVFTGTVSVADAEAEASDAAVCMGASKLAVVLLAALVPICAYLLSGT